MSSMKKGSGSFRVKVYRKKKEMLVAACDSEILGKVFREGELRFEVSSEFYDGEEVAEDVLSARLKVATIGNIVGERAVKVAIDMGFVDRYCVLTIEGVPHAQFVRM